MILREAWQEVYGGLQAGEREKRETCGDTCTLERWEQVRGKVGGKLDGWREGERE